MNTHKRGAILFLAVGAIAVLSILTLGATSSVMQELKLAKTVTENASSFYVTQSAILLTRFLFADDDSPGIITLYDLRSRQIPLGEKTLGLSFVDEESRLNIAAAPKDVIERLPGMENEELLAQSIEQSLIVAKEELLLIKNMTPEIYGQIKNLVTAFGFNGVNVNTAGDQVLSVLGCDENTISAIKNYRNGPDGTPGTEDDQWFASTEEIASKLEGDLSQGQREVLGKLVGSRLMGISSDYIAIYGRWGAGQNQSSSARPFKVTVNLTTGAIVSWDDE
jgi:type II secretory pathway component PulK